MDHDDSCPLKDLPERGAADISWVPPARPVRLERDAVHVWASDLWSEAAESSADESLGETERRRAERLRSERDRALYRTGRTFLRRVLAAYLDVEPADLRFSRGRHGKPHLLSPRAKNRSTHFNLSHSHGLALLAVAGSWPVGVDIERMREFPDADQIARRFFSTPETKALKKSDPEERTSAFFRAWTRKEAIVKALGGGLAVPLDSFSVRGDPSGRWTRARWEGNRPTDGTWYVRDLAPAPQWVGAIATPTEQARVEVYRWD